MNLPHDSSLSEIAGIPRVSGGEPEYAMDRFGLSAYSPRERG